MMKRSYQPGWILAEDLHAQTLMKGLLQRHGKIRNKLEKLRHQRLAMWEAITSVRAKEMVEKNNYWSPGRAGTEYEEWRMNSVWASRQ